LTQNRSGPNYTFSESSLKTCVLGTKTPPSYGSLKAWHRERKCNQPEFFKWNTLWKALTCQQHNVSISYIPIK